MTIGFSTAVNQMAHSDHSPIFNPERKNMNNPLPKKISLETDLCDEIDALEAQSADLLAALKRFVEIHDTATNAQAAIKIIEEGWPPRGYRLQEETKP
jgi:Tfp pilus assembly protein PilN